MFVDAASALCAVFYFWLMIRINSFIEHQKYSYSMAVNSTDEVGLLQMMIRISSRHMGSFCWVLLT